MIRTRTILPIIGFVVLAAGVVIVSQNIKKNQDVRKKAQTENTSVQQSSRMIQMPLIIDQISQPINVVRYDLHYNPDEMEIVELSEDYSFGHFFIEKKINNKLGYARLMGGIFNPGYNQNNGVWANLVIKAKKEGEIRIQILPTTKILANDGKGTDLWRGKLKTFTIDNDVETTEKTKKKIYYDPDKVFDEKFEVR